MGTEKGGADTPNYKGMVARAGGPMENRTCGGGGETSPTVFTYLSLGTKLQ